MVLWFNGFSNLNATLQISTNAIRLCSYWELVLFGTQCKDEPTSSRLVSVSDSLPLPAADLLALWESAMSTTFGAFARTKSQE